MTAKKHKKSSLDEIIKELSKEEKESMTHAKACKIVACNPSVMILAQIVDKHPEIDFEKTKEVVKEINRRLFRRNLYKAPSVMVGTAIYLANKELNQEQAADMANITTIPIRTTMRAIKLERKGGAKHVRKLYTEGYEKSARKRLIEREKELLREKVAKDIRLGIIPYAGKMTQKEAIERFRQLYGKKET